MTIKSRVLFVLDITLHLEILTKKLLKHGWEVGIASDVPSASHLEGLKADTISAIQKFKAIGIGHFFIPFPAPPFSFPNIRNSFESLLKLNTIILTCPIKSIMELNQS